MAVDADEQMEKMCSKCKEEVTSDKSCTRCGKDIDNEETFINPNFDHNRFNRLKEGGE